MAEMRYRIVKRTWPEGDRYFVEKLLPGWWLFNKYLIRHARWQWVHWFRTEPEATVWLERLIAGVRDIVIAEYARSSSADGFTKTIVV